MKAVILEIRGKKAAVLSEDGLVSQVRNRQYQIGEEIDIKAEGFFSSGNKWMKSVAGMAAALLILSGGSAWAYYTPYSYVSIDVNPSIEYTINRVDRVLSVRAANDGASLAIDNLDVKNKTIYAAVGETLKEFGKEGYLLDKDEDGILDGIFVSASSKSKDKQQKLVSTLRIELQKDVFGGNTQLTEQQKLKDGIGVIGVDKEEVTEAHSYGITPSKTALIRILQESAKDPGSVDFTEWSDKSMEEILAAINENREKEGLASDYDVDDVEEDYDNSTDSEHRYNSVEHDSDSNNDSENDSNDSENDSNNDSENDSNDSENDSNDDSDHESEDNHGDDD